MNPLDAIPGWVKPLALAAALAALTGLYSWRVHVERDYGRDEVQAKWDRAISLQRAADLQQAAENAQETRRRLQLQQGNQLAQDKELARARDDAARNSRDADQLRQQGATTAKQWRDALGNSPTVIECTSAGDAIGVLADVLGRADRRAGFLASYADTARAAGLKCERDYDSLGAGSAQPQALEAMK